MRDRAFIFPRTLAISLALIACTDEAPPAARRARTPIAVLEGRDGLYVTDATGALRRVTALRVAGFDHDSLAAKQREGVVILYWAAAPAPSPDGRRIAYATNREAVARDTSGQSVWLLDLATGEERPLVDDAGRSYRPVGWLDGAVVYIGDEPGVWLVDPETRARRAVASGTWIAVANDGSALAVADNVPADPVLRVMTGSQTIDVPPAPPGFVYLAQGAFDAHGRLELEAAADSGRTRRRLLFDPRTRALDTRP